MPLYEYRCGACSRKFTWLVGMVAASTPTCDRCGSIDAARVAVSRFARRRTDSETLDALADAMDSGDLDDPATMRRFANELGDGAGNEFDEYVDDAQGDP